MIGSSLVGLGTSLLSSNSQKKIAKDTQRSNEQIANQTLAQQQAQFNDVKSGASPYLDTGRDALGQLSDPAKNFEASPGYDFRLNQGTQAVLGNKATSGLLSSGAAVKALNNYAQGQASNEYGNWWNQQAQRAGMGLQGLGYLSSAASGNAAALGQNAANRMNANNTFAADANTANQTMFNGIGQAAGGLFSSPMVNSMASKLGSSFGNSSYSMTNQPQTFSI